VVGPAISVFPSGYDQSWDAGSCCGAAYSAGVDDVSFLEAVVREVLRTQPDAAQRVYLVGYSNGGRMAMRMACADPGAFAGVAAVEAVPAAPCEAMTPLPTLLVASSEDPLLTVATTGAPKQIQGWVEPTVGATVTELEHLDGCRGSGSVAVTGTLTSTSWSTCAGSGRLEYDLYQGGSHRWPRGGGPTPAAEALIARFLLGTAPR
jgi:polyhydroxybutyrate depolymerase